MHLAMSSPVCVPISKCTNWHPPLLSVLYHYHQPTQLMLLHRLQCLGEQLGEVPILILSEAEDLAATLLL
jgi:hypothetical protein